MAISRSALICFNPCRVFTLAATTSCPNSSSIFRWFQSLSGFHARCNIGEAPGSHYLKGCFNPCRVFTLAATHFITNREPFTLVVSIPVGFSRSLQLPVRFLSRGEPPRFNPCRVFTLAATKEAGIPSVLNRSSFNPCRVFTLAATTRFCRIGQMRSSQVSIPVGFSRSLQRQWQS